MNQHSVSVSVNGKEIVIETGKIARLASGSVTIRCNETILLCTACRATSNAEVDFFPLRIDYQEKFSSAGKSLGGFLKREGKPTEREVLTCRLIDRPIRPMFPEGYYDEVQVLSYVLSYDGQTAPEPLAICGCSAALAISEIPLIKPVAAVRIGKLSTGWVINPTYDEMQESTLELILAGTEDAILMIEGNCEFLKEEQLLEAIEEGQAAIAKICRAIDDLQKLCGKEKKIGVLRLPSEELKAELEAAAGNTIEAALRLPKKTDREKALGEIEANLLKEFVEVKGNSKLIVKGVIKSISSNKMRQMILKENKRSDGRSSTEIRPISVETSLLPRTHGSALFTRGETQSLAVCTLGGETMAQRFEDLNQDSTRKFYLQYTFPPFSVGEVGRVGAPGRREIGHGKLAENALSHILPSADQFPYTIRLESNITESNGSSSMASVCGGCLAMMDAGIPISNPIAGIAMGLILEENNFAILSDILGSEDALGDMDFKVAGNQHGITAFQLDIKVEGITHNIMKAALMQAREGYLHILKKMVDICPKSKEQISSLAPRIETIQIKPSKIGTVIGPGGKQIRAISEETGAQIDINDSGLVSISASSLTGLERAKEIIINLTSDVEIGKTYKGKITSIVPFGLFVKIYEKEGLLHVSEIALERGKDHAQAFKIGDMIEVKVLDVNDRGQIKLSQKALQLAAK